MNLSTPASKIFVVAAFLALLLLGFFSYLLITVDDPETTLAHATRRGINMPTDSVAALSQHSASLRQGGSQIHQDRSATRSADGNGTPSRSAISQISQTTDSQGYTFSTQQRTSYDTDGTSATSNGSDSRPSPASGMASSTSNRAETTMPAAPAPPVLQIPFFYNMNPQAYQSLSPAQQSDVAVAVQDFTEQLNALKQGTIGVTELNEQTTVAEATLRQQLGYPAMDALMSSGQLDLANQLTGGAVTPASR
jgi:hypothetical protein